MGVWYGLWWVWLERCRDGRYAVNASRCDVWVVCAHLLLVFLHDWYLHLLYSAFPVTCFGAFFLCVWGGEEMA